MAKTSEREDQNLCIGIGGRHRIVASELEFILQQRNGAGSKIVWHTVSYHGTIQAAVDKAFQARIRTSKAQSAEELHVRVEEIRQEFLAALAPLLSAPQVR